MTELMQTSALISQSPNSLSFNTYSSGALAKIAVRVVQEFADDDIFSSWKDHDNDAVFSTTQNDDDFEFPFVCEEPATSPVSADEIFFNGKIKPLYHPFVANSPPPPAQPKPARLPLGKLFKEEKESESCSSSESGDLDGVPSESYCVWTPRAVAVSPGQCKKSNSTGSSKRWKFRDLLYRSHSDGRKDTFAFLAAKRNSENNDQNNGGKGNKENNEAGGNGNSKEGNDRKKGGEDGEKDGNDSVVEKEVKSKKVGKDKEGEKRRTFLPYRQELVGIFYNVNGVGSILRGE